MEEAKNSSMNRIIKHSLMATNCFLLVLGNIGGPLVSRLYFVHGGRGLWLLSLLETAGFPILLLPLSLSYLRRRQLDPNARPLLITLPVAVPCAFLGLVTGVVDFLYAYGLSFLPVSTSALLNSSQLGFTALFAFLIVGQRFTPFRLNAVALLTAGAVVLGLHAGGDRPAGESKGRYATGFMLTVGSAALNALVLPLVELTYAKARQVITYTLVMEMQFVMGFSATAFSFAGLLASKEFQAIPKEAKAYGLGEIKYYVVVVFSAILWQCYCLGAVGVIFCVHTLLTGIICSMCIPVTGFLGVVLFREKFSAEKFVALALSLWGMASYTYGELLESKKKKKGDSHELALEAQVA
ncbi:purine permease 1-like isoform X2 [Iris pallida]|uniref:Probable purine permease n=1 Tax=Iris pallida TaxID=29817 RepID=A0AAX6FHH9_IRIPA|nr:purine permease 1-like isoform X2 [Iris pallida]